MQISIQFKLSVSWRQTDIAPSYLPRIQPTTLLPKTTGRLWTIISFQSAFNELGSGSLDKRTSLPQFYNKYRLAEVTLRIKTVHLTKGSKSSSQSQSGSAAETDIPRFVSLELTVRRHHSAVEIILRAWMEKLAQSVGSKYYESRVSLYLWNLGRLYEQYCPHASTVSENIGENGVIILLIINRPRVQ